MNLNELKLKSVAELAAIAEERGIENIGRLRKKDLIFKLLQHIVKSKEKEDISGYGVLEIVSDGHGFLRTSDSSYLPGPDDIYVSPNQIRRFHLRKGDTIHGKIRPPKDNERFFALLKIDQINFTSVEEELRNKILFENLIPIFPSELLKMELGDGTSRDLTGRIIDLIAPIGKGQRGLLVSPPKAGKTLMLKNICHAIERNSPECYVMVLLIDERPEEVTDMQRSVHGEVIASTFDEQPQRHVQVAEMVIEKARRLVEHKKDVVVFLDSITRLARAYNAVQPPSSRVLTGGLDASSLERPKRFFGSARNIEEGGSLTILATALVDTGSKMDDVIYEEFKGTGNMEVHLDRIIAEKRIYPAINVPRSSTRRDDLLVSPEKLSKMWILRKILPKSNSNGATDDTSGIEFLIDRLQKTKNNDEFFALMKNSSRGIA